MKQKHELIFHSFEIMQETITTGWNMPYSHYHDHYEFYILTSGSRFVTIGEEKYIVSALDVTLFPKGVYHQSSGNEPFSGICCHFSSSFLHQYFTKQVVEQFLSCFQYPVIHLTEDAFLQIKQLADTFSYDAEDGFLLLGQLLHLLYLNIKNASSNTLSQKEKICEETKSKGKKISKEELVLHYISENYTLIQNIQMICDTFTVSESYIFAVVQKNYHMTPKAYINELRIHNACRRLIYSNKPLSMIAQDCGYTSTEYFIRVFKKAMGMTPTAYRRQNNC